MPKGANSLKCLRQKCILKRAKKWHILVHCGADIMWLRHFAADPKKDVVKRETRNLP